jgi:hypothetical protein
MKPSHTPAVAFIIWYLLVPPPMASNPRQPDLRTPLSRWSHIGTYHHPNECHGARNQLYRKAEKAAPTTANKFLKAQIFAGQCVAAGDPRLR